MAEEEREHNDRQSNDIFDEHTTRVKKTKKADLSVEAVQAKPTASDEAEKINQYLRQYWANKPKMEKLKANITMLIQKFAIDHPEDLFRIQAQFVNFSMIEDTKALKDLWHAQFPTQEAPVILKPFDDTEKMKADLMVKGFPEATWKKQKEPYFAHLKTKKPTGEMDE